jgi:tetratricopeptide (TPR) repeat protein
VTRVRFTAFFVFWLVVAGFLVGYAVYRVQGNVPCDAANRILQAGRLDEADREFKALLQAQPRLECASDGLDGVITARCDAGRLLIPQGALDEAAKDFQAALKEAPQRICGLDGLESVRLERCQRLSELAASRPDLAATAAEAIVSKAPDASLFDCANYQLDLLPIPSPAHMP